jgi:hypothetical protein
MAYSEEFCIIHGYTLIYDWKSGFDICPYCEEEKLENKELNNDETN